MGTERNGSKSTKDKVFDIAVTKNGLFWSFAFLWTMLIALGWTSEEPSKIRTIIVVFTVFILAILIIRYAKNKSIITSKKLWIFIFLIKLTLVAIILQYLWIPAFNPHRAIGTFDPVVFDYYGKLLAESNFNINLIHGVYNYVGQIYYIGAIYWLFGVSTFYVGIFNALFSLVAFLAITAILVGCSGNKKGWYFMGLGMLFPELLYYDAIPGKEVISTCMVALSILFIYKFLINKSTKYLLFLLLSLGVLTSVRAVMSIAVVVIGIIWIIVKYRYKLKLIFLYGVIVVFMLFLLLPLIIKYTGGTPNTVGTLLNLSQIAEHGIRITPGEKFIEHYVCYV